MSLRARLLSSYLLVVAIFGCIVSLVMLILASGVSRNVTYQRLDSLATTSVNFFLRSETLLGERRLEQLKQNFAQQAKREDVRVLLVDPQGGVFLDSAGPPTGWRLQEQPQYRQQADGLKGSWREGAQVWLFVSRPLRFGQGRWMVVFAAPVPNRIGWFVENLMPQFAMAGLVALILSALLAGLISRSVARPLQELAGAAAAVAEGDYTQTVPGTGPPEVQSLAQNFNRMVRQVQASRSAQQDFIANVSHELKTPLTSIQGYSQAILDGTADDPVTIQRSAEVIYDEAERMRRMVTQLLHLARLESGQTAMQRRPLDLGELLDNLVERWRPRAQEAGVELGAQVSSLPPVSGDGDWLIQVFGNLIDNALKHTPKGGRVTLAAKPLAPTEGSQGRSSGVWRRGEAQPKAGEVEVSVTDTGAGIPAEDLPRIFERFYQVDKSRKRTGSVGLGLAIAREVVEAHGGSIRAESLVDLGTRFTVVLPAQPADTS